MTLTLAMQQEWARGALACDGSLARWRKVGEDLIGFNGAGSPRRPRWPRKRKPLYLDRRYGLPPRPRKKRTGGGKRKAVAPATPAPSWGDHGLF